MSKLKFMWLAVLLCVSTGLGSTLTDADLSDSLTGWSAAASGGVVPALTLNSTEVKAGNYSIQASGTPGGTGLTFIGMSRTLSEASQFTKNTLETFTMNFKVDTTDTDWACRLYLYDSSYTIVGQLAIWTLSGDYDAYWETGLGKNDFLWTSGQEDTVVSMIKVCAEYQGEPTTILVDNLSITTVPEPTSIAILSVGLVVSLWKKRIRK
jgi:hypothetical protein